MKADITSERLRIVFLHYQDHVRAGGSLRVGQLLANHLPADKVEAHIVFAYGSPGPVAEVSSVPCHYGRVNGRYDAGGWLRLRRLVRDLQPDILHFHDPLTVFRLFLTGLNAHRVTHCHGRPLVPPTGLVQRLNAWLQKRDTDIFLCIDPVAADTLVRFCLARREQCSVLTNAVDFNWLQHRLDRIVARTRFGLPREAKIIGMVCRVIEAKGFPDLFRLMRQLPAEWHAAIFGEGSDRSSLEAAVRVSPELAGRVHFLGPVNDVRGAYSAMNAYWFATAHEPFGLVLAEAMACRVPVFGLHGLGEYREIDPPLVDTSVANIMERENPARLQTVSEWSQPETDDLLRPLAEAISHFDMEETSNRTMVDRAQSRIRIYYDIGSRARQLLELYYRLPSLHPYLGIAFSSKNRTDIE